MDIVARHADAQPDKAAVIDGDQRLTWRDYDEARNRLAHALGDLGLVAGEHVVLYAHNSLEVLLASAAARALGLIPVPMNHRLTAEEVAYILDDSDAVAVFASDAFVPMLERVRAGRRVCVTWCCSAASGARGRRTWMTSSPPGGRIRWRSRRGWAAR